jgi:thymidine phosphorylase
MKVLQVADHRADITATRTGQVLAIDNRKLAKIAKLAGAPNDPLAGVDFHAPVGTTVRPGQALFTVYAETPGQLAYALSYAQAHSDIIRVGEL